MKSNKQVKHMMQMNVSVLKKMVIASGLALFLISNISVHAQALNDRKKPFVVEADKATYSDIQQTGRFTGKVVLTQGSLKVKAEMVEVVVDPEGYQFAKAVAAPGRPIVLEQKRANSNESIRASSQELIYDGKQNIILLSKQAVIQRLDAKGKVLDQVEGDQLIYNQITELFEAKGSPSKRTKVTIGGME